MWMKSVLVMRLYIGDHRNNWVLVRSPGLNQGMLPDNLGDAEHKLLTTFLLKLIGSQLKNIQTFFFGGGKEEYNEMCLNLGSFWVV